MQLLHLQDLFLQKILDVGYKIIQFERRKMKTSILTLALKFSEKMRMPRLGFFLRLSSIGLAFWSTDRVFAAGNTTSLIIMPDLIAPDIGIERIDIINLIIERLQDPTLTIEDREILINQMDYLKRVEDHAIQK